MPTPGTRERHAFCGAPDAVSCPWHFADHERKWAVQFVAVLLHLVATDRDGPLALVLDQAPAHTARAVQTWLKAHPHLTLHRLPTYAALELNPAERIRDLMKSAVAADRLAGSIGELVAAARRFFTALAPHPFTLPIAAYVSCLSFGSVLGQEPHSS